MVSRKSVLLALAQTLALVYASCDPTTSASQCPAIPAMPASKTYSLSTSNTADFTYIMPSGISGDSSGLVFTLAKQGDAPTIVTNDYLLYGNVKAQIKTAPGVGMVSAFILMSDVLDEIDYEWLGAVDSQVQTNYFYRGETASYDRGGVSAVSTPAETTHTYEVDWTATAITWSIDGVAVRTLNAADTTSYGYPSTPCQIKIGVWASGDPSNAQGTIEWGGGLINYAAGPYKMTLYSLEVTSYTTAGSFQYAVGGSTFSTSPNSVAAAGSSGTSAAKKSTLATSTTSAGRIGFAGATTTAAAAGNGALTTMTTSTADSPTQIVVVAAQAAKSSAAGTSGTSGGSTTKSTAATTSARTTTTSSPGASTNAATAVTISTSTSIMSFALFAGFSWLGGFL